MSNIPDAELNEGTGETSQAKRREVVPAQGGRERLRQGLAQGMTFYEYILLLSLVFILVASVQMYFNIQQFGNFPFSLPYKTGSVLIGK